MRYTYLLLEDTPEYESVALASECISRARCRSPGLTPQQELAAFHARLKQPSELTAYQQPSALPAQPCRYFHAITEDRPVLSYAQDEYTRVVRSDCLKRCNAG